MKHLSFILLLALVCCVQSNQNDEQFFLKIKDQEFGRTIIQTLQLELSSKQSTEQVDRITALLRQMREDITNEQKDAEATLNTDTCTARINDVLAVIKKASEKKSDDERRLPLLKEEQKDKQQQADDKVGQEKRNQDRIAIISEERKQSHAEYETRRDELIGLISALQEAKGIISQLKGNSFIQMSEAIFTEVHQHHQKFLKYYPNQQGFHGLVNILLESLQDKGIQQQGVQKVVQIIENLVESIYEVQKQELKAEDEKQSLFQMQKARLELEITRLAGTIAQLRANVEIITQKILEVQNDVASQDQIIQVKTIEKGDWDKTCQDSQRGFELQSKNRKEQLEIINSCIEIFETRWDKSTQSFIQRIRFD